MTCKSTKTHSIIFYGQQKPFPLQLSCKYKRWIETNFAFKWSSIGPELVLQLFLRSKFLLLKTNKTRRSIIPFVVVSLKTTFDIFSIFCLVWSKVRLIWKQFLNNKMMVELKRLQYHAIFWAHNVSYGSSPNECNNLRDPFTWMYFTDRRRRY